MDEPQYVLKPGVRIVPFDSGSKDLPFQVIGTERRVAVSGPTAALFSFLREPRSVAVLDEYASQNLLLSEPGLVSLLERPPFSDFIGKTPLPDDPKGRGQSDRTKGYLTIKRDIFSPEIVNRVTRHVEFLFAPSCALIATAFAVIVHARFLLSPQYHHPYTLSFTPSQWIGAYFGAYLALLFHEIGHCAACTKYGGRAGSIGIGLYLVWPVLYADTTDSWTLRRRHRAVVDVAGIYFHLICSTACLLLASYTSSPVLFVISKSAILSTMVNLNPFFRFDGYWLVTDLTGIPNLRQASSQFWRYLFRSIWDRNARSAPPKLLRIAPTVQVLFGVYCLSTVVFFGRIVVRLFRNLPYRLLALPHKFSYVWLIIASHPLSLAAVKSIFMFVLFLIGLVQTIVFATRRLIRAGRGARSAFTEVRSNRLIRNS